MLFGIKINFGGDIPLIYFTTALATFLGIALGFAIGNLGSFAIEKKESILVGITLTGCALSGLMYGDMKVIITEKAPIVNKINPAAVISDSYYCLNMFGAGSRYFMTLIYMLRRIPLPEWSFCLQVKHLFWLRVTTYWPDSYCRSLRC